MRAFLLTLAVLAAIGCGEQQPANPGASAAGSPVSVPVSKQPLLPDFDQTSKLALVKHAGPSGSVTVGMNLEDALAVYAEPKDSSEKWDLPEGIAAPFTARGWQTRDEGFGMILYKGQVAAAVYQVEGTSQDRLNEIFQLQKDAYGEGTFMPGGYAKYWFWQSPQASADQVLMVCAVETQPGKYNVTAAIGTASVMHAIHMSPAAASNDLQKADKIVAAKKAQAAPNHANSSNQPGHS